MDLFISLVAGSIGSGYFLYGKKANDIRFLIAGILLIAYPFFISQLTISIIIGVVLIAGPFFLKG